MSDQIEDVVFTIDASKFRSVARDEWVPYRKAPRVRRALWLWRDRAFSPWETAAWGTLVCLAIVAYQVAYGGNPGVLIGAVAGLTFKSDWSRLWNAFVNWTQRGRCNFCGAHERDVGELRDVEWDGEMCCAACDGRPNGWTRRA